MSTRHANVRPDRRHRPANARCGRCDAVLTGMRRRYCPRCRPTRAVQRRVGIDQQLVTIERAIRAIRRALQEDQ